MKDKKERKNSKEEQINIKNIIKENIKIVIGIVLGIILISGTTAYGATILFQSDQVSYDNTTSGMGASNVQSALDELYVESTSYQLFEQRVSAIENKLYPVGSIYISMTDDTVAKVQARMGGTWEVFGKGRTLVGFDSSDTNFDGIGETGGEKTHTLTTTEIPAHTHGSKTLTGGFNTIVYKTQSAQGIASITLGTMNGALASGSSYGGATFNINATHEHSSVGGNGAHNNLQPYITVYMYRRTA